MVRFFVDLAAHRQVIGLQPFINMGNGWVSLQPCLRAAKLIIMIHILVGRHIYVSEVDVRHD